MNLDILIIAVLLAATIWTVMTGRVLRAVIGLALISIALSLVMFRLNSPLAGVFELSVCAGLISVILFTTISFTRRITVQGYGKRKQLRFARFWALPIIMLAVGIIMYYFRLPLDFTLPAAPAVNNVKIILWHSRQLDLLGQIMILLIGALGVISLFTSEDKTNAN
jgi:NADH-quinone oxidoreductase subunit J